MDTQQAIMVGAHDRKAALGIGVVVRGAVKPHHGGAFQGPTLRVGHYASHLVVGHDRDVVIAHLALDHLDRVIAGTGCQSGEYHYCGKKTFHVE